MPRFQSFFKYGAITLAAIGIVTLGGGAASRPALGQEAAAVRQDYEQKFAEWKTLLNDLRKLKNQYNAAEQEELPGIRQQWDALVQKAEEMIPVLRDAAFKAYLAAPNEDRELMRFLVKLAGDDIDHDQYESALELAQPLIENGCDDPHIFTFGGIAAFALNDYENAEIWLNQAQSRQALEPAEGETGPRSLGPKFLAQVSDYKKWWEEEQALREAEAKADDLPRVKLTTTQGEIVLELFENEAPDTVGNFISLIERPEGAFYDDTVFHRVIAGFMAQGGSPTGDGTGGPGYEIYCECHKPNFRRHFRGSISMAHTGAPNTGGSQFFLMFAPASHLDGLHTVFGRVVEGMDVLSRVERGDPEANGAVASPDKILKAEVLRKRDHEYVPNKVQ